MAKKSWMGDTRLMKYKNIVSFFRGGLKMQLLRFQIAVFFKTPAERPDLLSGNMPKELLELFDLIPLVNPIPQIPQGFANIPDIPIVTLQSSHQGYQGTISRGRADFYYNYTGPKDYGKILEEVAQYAKQFMEFFYNKQQVNRIGCVVNTFFPEEHPVKMIAKKYANRDLQNSEELAVRFNKRTQVGGILLNNIMNVRSETLTFDKQAPSTGIILECDINNVVQPIQLTDTQCSVIFNYALNQYNAEEVKKLIS